MIELLILEQTSLAAPSQWEGVTKDDREFYARYRWGMLRIELDGEIIFKEKLSDNPGGSFMSTEKLLEILKRVEIKTDS